MHWTKQYLSPKAKNTKLIFAIGKTLNKYFEIVFFGLLPHTEVENPPQDIPEINDLEESGLKAIEKIYDASLSRIENLEKKAFNILSYITALFTIIALLYTLFFDYALKVWLLFPVVTLLLTLFVSFRCLSIKSIKQVFIGDIYRFDSEKKPIKTGVELHRNFLRSAIHNEAKGDEIVDILQASRMLLATSMFTLFIVVGLMIAHGADHKVSREELFLKSISESMKKIEKTLISVSDEILINEMQNQKIDMLNSQLLQLKKELDGKISKNK